MRLFFFREQRVTALLVGILNGVSVLFTSVLQVSSFHSQLPTVVASAIKKKFIDLHSIISELVSSTFQPSPGYILVPLFKQLTGYFELILLFNPWKVGCPQSAVHSCSKSRIPDPITMIGVPHVLWPL